MSLILDALRKAEADRQRGAVPGLHTPPPLAPLAPQRAVGLRWWPLLALLGLLGAAAGVLLAQRPDATGRGVRPAERPSAGSVPLPISTVPPDAAPARPPARPPATGPAVTPAPWPLVVSAPPPPPPPPPPRPPPSPPVALPAPRPAPILTQVRRLAELPAEQRRELPPLVVSGSVWSEQPAARFVVLDGQVLREGDSSAPGLVLVKLAPRSVTLRWRDGLIELPF